MRLSPATILLAACLSGISPAHADEPQYNRVNLTESAQLDVENDLLVAILFAQAEGRDAAAPSDEVNHLIDWAVGMAKDHPGVKVQTLGYRTQAVTYKSNIRSWRVNQSLRLEGEDGRLLGDLIGKLQERLQVQSIAYQLSDVQRRRHLDDLTALALTRFQARADHVAKSLQRKGYRVVRININDGHDGPVPLVRGMMMEAAAADAAVAPARLEAGTQQITVSINGEIELTED